MEGELPNSSGQNPPSLLGDIFNTLDRKSRGFLLRAELGPILQAALAIELDDVLRRLVTKRGGSTSAGPYYLPSRIHFDTFADILKNNAKQDVEDLKWFCANVIAVEDELILAWRSACALFCSKVERLFDRGLHAYVLRHQPERVARWLALRVRGVEKSDHLGVSAAEVETLFADDTAADIQQCIAALEYPFLKALDL